MTTSRKETAPTLSASEARSNFNDLVNRVQYGGERVTVTRQGKAAAVLINVTDLICWSVWRIACGVTSPLNDSKKRSGPEQEEPTVSASSATSASKEGQPEARAREVRVELTRAAEKDLRDIRNRKHLGQIARKIDALSTDPRPQDARALQGEIYRANGWNFFRVDVGEYRIVYDLDESSEVLTIVTETVIGRRDDDEVYRLLERRYG